MRAIVPVRLVEDDVLTAIDTDANELNDNNTVFVRTPFTVAPGATFDRLKLRMKYDDGFVAYLNGVKVAESNAPATPAWNSEATDVLEAGEFIEFDERNPQAYDILISLEPLGSHGAKVPGGRSRDARAISLPMSELGSYASRVDFGVPTIYLGWPETLKGEDGRVFETAAQYFGSEAFKHMALHELGHALGFPHNWAASLDNFGSVMEYPTPRVKVVNGKLDLSEAFQSKIGAWDVMTARYAYTDFPKEKEAAGLEAIIR